MVGRGLGRLVRWVGIGRFVVVSVFWIGGVFGTEYSVFCLGGFEMFRFCVEELGIKILCLENTRENIFLFFEEFV